MTGCRGGLVRGVDARGAVAAAAAATAVAVDLADASVRSCADDIVDSTPDTACANSTALEQMDTPAAAHTPVEQRSTMRQCCAR